jgi:RNA polymerase sigma-70 factor (ECF subfamily)
MEKGLLDSRYFTGVLATPPRVEARQSRDEWILLHWYGHEDGEAVRAITRVNVDDGRVTGVRNYFYNPELIAELCTELGVPARTNGYRWWGLTQCAEKGR